MSRAKHSRHFSSAADMKGTKQGKSLKRKFTQNENVDLLANCCQSYSPSKLLPELLH
jgi:hypothetical protein